MAYALLSTYTLIILVRYYRGQPTIGLFFAWMLVAPAVTFFGRLINSSYIMLPLLASAILFGGGKIVLPSKEIRQYLWMLLSINIFYVFSWLVFNRNNPDAVISTLLGAIRISLLLLFCWIMNARTFKDTMLVEISKMVRWLLILNTLAIIFQMINPTAANNVLSQLLNETGNYWLSAMQVGTNKFNRNFGIFGLPLSMGIFCLFAITYMLLIDKDTGKGTKILCCAAAIFGGITAASKTCIFGTLVLLFLISVKSLIQKKMTPKGLLIGGVIVGVLILLVTFSEQIADLVSDLFGANAARPFEFMNFDNYQRIFVSRFSADRGNLIAGGTLDVVKRYFLFGVGVSSLEDEPVMDNAVLVILHSGGLLCLSIVVFYYIRLLWNNRKDANCLLAVLIVLVAGVGFDTWTQVTSLWLILSVAFKHYSVPDGGGAVQPQQL